MKVLPARKMAIARAATTAKIELLSAKPMEFNQHRRQNHRRHVTAWWHVLNIGQMQFCRETMTTHTTWLGRLCQEAENDLKPFWIHAKQSYQPEKSCMFRPVGGYGQHCQHRNWKVKLSLETKTLPVDSKWSLGLIPFQASPLLQALSRKAQHMGGTFPKGPCSWINDG